MKNVVYFDIKLNLKVVLMVCYEEKCYSNNVIYIYFLVRVLSMLSCDFWFLFMLR